MASIMGPGKNKELLNGWVVMPRIDGTEVACFIFNRVPEPDYSVATVKEIRKKYGRAVTWTAQDAWLWVRSLLGREPCCMLPNACPEQLQTATVWVNSPLDYRGLQEPEPLDWPELESIKAGDPKTAYANSRRGGVEVVRGWCPPTGPGSP